MDFKIEGEYLLKYGKIKLEKVLLGPKKKLEGIEYCCWEYI